MLLAVAWIVSSSLIALAQDVSAKAVPAAVASAPAAGADSALAARVEAARSAGLAEAEASMVGLGVTRLLAMQEGDAKDQWPYEGVYRVRGQIPIGYRVGGTSIAAMALIKRRARDGSRTPRRDPAPRGSSQRRSSIRS